MQRSLLFAALLLAAPPAFAPAAFAQGIISEWNNVRPPPPPTLAKVTLEPATTALLVLDLAAQTCNNRQRCPPMLPTVAKLVDHARAKHWTVIYTLGVASKPTDILPPVKQLGPEPIVVGPPDKFVGTDLEQILHQKGIKTVVTVGSAAEGAVLETAASAAFRGFDVVVPVDGMASSTLYAEQYVAWDLANAPRLTDRVKLTSIAMID